MQDGQIDKIKHLLLKFISFSLTFVRKVCFMLCRQTVIGN